MDLISQVNNTQPIGGRRVNVTVSGVSFRRKGVGIVKPEEATSLGINFQLKDQSVVWTSFNLKSSGQPTWALERLLSVTGAKNTDELIGKKLSIIPQAHEYMGSERLQATSFGPEVKEEAAEEVFEIEPSK